MEINCLFLREQRQWVWNPVYIHSFCGFKQPWTFRKLIKIEHKVISEIVFTLYTHHTPILKRPSLMPLSTNKNFFIVKYYICYLLQWSLLARFQKIRQYISKWKYSSMADDKNIQHHVHVLAFEWNAGNVAFYLWISKIWNQIEIARYLWY